MATNSPDIYDGVDSEPDDSEVLTPIDDFERVFLPMAGDSHDLIRMFKARRVIIKTKYKDASSKKAALSQAEDVIVEQMI